MGLAAARVVGPPAVAIADSVIVELETSRIVVPAGMPAPVMSSPASRSVVLPMPVTDSGPASAYR